MEMASIKKSPAKPANKSSSAITTLQKQLATLNAKLIKTKAEQQKKELAAAKKTVSAPKTKTPTKTVKAHAPADTPTTEKPKAKAAATKPEPIATVKTPSITKASPALKKPKEIPAAKLESSPHAEAIAVPSIPLAPEHSAPPAAIPVPIKPAPLKSKRATEVIDPDDDIEATPKPPVRSLFSLIDE